MAKIKWTTDPAHSRIGFSVKHMVIVNVTGNFEKFTIAAETEGEDFTNASFSFSAETASVNTGNPDRDKHLRSADFFDSEKYPLLTFKSGRLEKKGDRQYSLTGDLTIKAITRRVTLRAEHIMMNDPWGKRKALFSISGDIIRKEWELNWNADLEEQAKLVSDTVTLQCEVQLTKQL